MLLRGVHPAATARWPLHVHIDLPNHVFGADVNGMVHCFFSGEADFMFLTMFFPSKLHSNSFPASFSDAVALWEWRGIGRRNQWNNVGGEKC